MKLFKRFYVWGLFATYLMSTYFAAIVCYCGFILAFFGVRSLSLIALLEMMLVSLAVGVLQTLVLPGDLDLTGGLLIRRTLVFSLIASAAAALVSALGGWFDPLGPAADISLGAVMFIGIFSLLLGIRYEQEMESASLNERLARLRRDGK